MAPILSLQEHLYIGNVIKVVYEEKKKEIVDKLAEVEFVSVPTDGGTSSNIVSFQDTDVHSLDEDLQMRVHTSFRSKGK